MKTTRSGCSIHVGGKLTRNYSRTDDMSLAAPLVSIAVQDRVDSNQLDPFRQPHRRDHHHRERLRHSLPRPPMFLPRRFTAVCFDHWSFGLPNPKLADAVCEGGKASTMTNKFCDMSIVVGKRRIAEAGPGRARHSARAASQTGYSNGAHGVTRPTRKCPD